LDAEVPVSIAKRLHLSQYSINETSKGSSS